MPRLLAINAVTHPGGAEIGLLRLLARLDGWEATVTTPGPGRLAERAVALRGARVRVARLAVGGLAAGSGALAVTDFPAARRMAAAHDVTYLNGTVAARLLPAVAGVARTVLHVHDLVERVPRHWHRADVVLADSEAVADRLGGLAPRVVFCPVELDVPAAAAPWAQGDGPVVGFVGRVEPRKGALDLVRAAPAIRAAVPGARIVLLGGDPFESNAEYGDRVAASEDVEILPWVDDAAAVMAHLDVLVVPSYAEPFGTVAAEAMAAGTPVVAAATGGLPEVVTHGHDGALVPPGRPDALAMAVADVLARRDELGTRARASARRFGADEYARRVESLIAA